MELKFSSTVRPKSPNPLQARRQKLIQKIDHEVNSCREVIGGGSVRSTWFWMEQDGTYFLPIRYGKHTLELKKGLFSIECKNLDEVEHALLTIRQMVMQGMFDEQLQKLAVKIRKRFEKGQ